MFWIRYQERDGRIVELPLNPAPSAIEYPDKRSQKVLTSQDGAVIVQRPMRDARPRKWLWRGHGPTAEPYASQWKILEGLEYRYRVENALPPSVGVWEDVSGVGGFARLDGNGQRVYTTVKVTEVDRTPRQGGGPVIYESVLSFYIDDPTFRAF